MFFHKNKSHKKQVRLLSWITLILILSVCLLAVLDAINVIDMPGFRDSPNNKHPVPGDSTIDYSPPTETEKKETESHKKELAKQMSAGTNQSHQSQKVVPVVTSWGLISGSNTVEVSGYVPNILENTGTCTLTLTKGVQKVSASTAATTNTQNMACGTVSIPVQKISSGKWDVSLMYSSPTTSGTSNQNISVDIP